MEAPPAAASQPAEPLWSEVVRRRKPPKSRPPPPVSKKAEKIALLRKRAPKTAAVTIDRPQDGGATLSEVMKKVATGINLVDLGVKVLTTRSTKAGGILLEVEGVDKAALLEGRIREVVGETARVRRPERKTPVLVLDVPDWVDADEVAAGMAKLGVPPTELVVGGQSRVNVRRSDNGRNFGVARVDVSVAAAIKLAEAKYVTVGWSRCRVKLLEKKQPTCYRCQEKGHLAVECGNASKPRRCFKCNGEGHIARDCSTVDPKGSVGAGPALK